MLCAVVVMVDVCVVCSVGDGGCLGQVDEGKIAT